MGPEIGSQNKIDMSILSMRAIALGLSLSSR